MSYNPYQVVKEFEEAVAEWAGAPYGVAVESCTAALFLSLLWRSRYRDSREISIPSFTYPGVAASIINSGNEIRFTDDKWKGIYELFPFRIVDSALRFKKDMYIPGTLYCLSFHAKKHLPIGRGGMILTDDKKAYEWLKLMRFDGRHEVDLGQDVITECGYNMYLTPEQAARGLMLFNLIKNKGDGNPDLKMEEQCYPDLSKQPAYR